jgi:hypothetical protein
LTPNRHPKVFSRLKPFEPAMGLILESAVRHPHIYFFIRGWVASQMDDLVVHFYYEGKLTTWSGYSAMFYVGLNCLKETLLSGYSFYIRTNFIDISCFETVHKFNIRSWNLAHLFSKTMSQETLTKALTWPCHMLRVSHHMWDSLNMSL